MELINFRSIYFLHSCSFQELITFFYDVYQTEKKTHKIIPANACISIKNVYFSLYTVFHHIYPNASIYITH